MLIVAQTDVVLKSALRKSASEEMNAWTTEMSSLQVPLAAKSAVF